MINCYLTVESLLQLGESKMFIQNSIRFIECEVKMIHSTVCPSVTPLILDTFEDCIFMENLLRSRLKTKESIYGFFFNQSNTFGLIKLTERNISDFFTHVYNLYLLAKGYRYFYCPDLFPVTEISIQDGDRFYRLLDWSINVVDEYYDVPEYVDSFKPFIDAYKFYRKKDIVACLLQNNTGVINTRIDLDKLSLKLTDYCFNFEVPLIGNFDENLYSINASLYRKEGFYFSYVLNMSECILELWISYSKDLICT